HAESRPDPPRRARAVSGSACDDPGCFTADDQLDRDRAVHAVSATRYRPGQLLRTNGRRGVPRGRHRRAVMRAPDPSGEEKPMQVEHKPWWMNKWIQPAFALVLAVVVGAAFSAGGDPKSGLISFAILAAFGGLLLLGGRSETVRAMRGDGRDER